MQNTETILFYGVGGQGVLTASEVCAMAAMLDGSHVKKSEVKGMAQRGGSVESYVRFGKHVYSPIPPDGSVDMLVCLYEGEYDRFRGVLKKGGIDLFPYLKKGNEAVGGKKIFLNSYMLGVLSSFLEIRESCWHEAMDRIFKREKEENRNYFIMGRRGGGKNDL